MTEAGSKQTGKPVGPLGSGWAKAINDFFSPGETCFIAGTKIRMADGSEKNIEDVEVGDKVRGRDGIINTVRGLERPVIGNRFTFVINKKVEFTGDHPFLSKEGSWKVADLELFKSAPRTLDSEPGKLEKGDILVTEDGEEQIESLEEKNERPSEEVVYDLKLDGDNTYTANGFIVHNCGERYPPQLDIYPPQPYTPD